MHRIVYIILASAVVVSGCSTQSQSGARVEGELYLTMDEIRLIEDRIPALQKGMSYSEVSVALQLDLRRLVYSASGHNPRAYLYSLWMRQNTSDEPERTYNLLILFSYSDDYKKQFFERAEMIKRRIQ